MKAKDFDAKFNEGVEEVQNLVVGNTTTAYSSNSLTRSLILRLDAVVILISFTPLYLMKSRC